MRRDEGIDLRMRLIVRGDNGRDERAPPEASPKYWLDEAGGGSWAAAAQHKLLLDLD